MGRRADGSIDWFPSSVFLSRVSNAGGVMNKKRVGGLSAA